MIPARVFVKVGAASVVAMAAVAAASYLLHVAQLRSCAAARAKLVAAEADLSAVVEHYADIDGGDDDATTLQAPFVGLYHQRRRSAADARRAVIEECAP